MSKFFSGVKHNYSLTVEESQGIKHHKTVSISQKYLQTITGIHGVTNGTFVLLPLVNRALEKLIALIDRELQSIGSQKVLMPSLIPSSLWKKSGRFDDIPAKEDLFIIHAGKENEMLLAPTHEEVVSHLLSSLTSTLSFKSFPIYLYQVTTKFRNEKRPKSGLIRTREFLMKDLYTFDVDLESARQTYETVTETYERIFRDLELTVSRVRADPGSMGGIYSHEYHVVSEAGQDVLLICRKCGHTLNEQEVSTNERRHHDEKTNNSDIEEGGNINNNKSESQTICPKCLGSTNKEVFLQRKKGIEVGHTFLLGDRYTLPFDCCVTNSLGKKVLMSMGCYGLGVTRLLASCLEVLSDPQGRGVRWPRAITPFDVVLIAPKDGSKEENVVGKPEAFMTDFADHLCDLGLDVLLDDRTHMTIGKRDKDHIMTGIPFMVIAGKSVVDDSADAKPRFEVVSTRDARRLFLTHCETLSFLDQQFKT
jgi:prolyl-tRNA synthetase